MPLAIRELDMKKALAQPLKQTNRSLCCCRNVVRQSACQGCCRIHGEFGRQKLNVKLGKREKGAGVATVQ
jgi:hypothetical protein